MEKMKQLEEIKQEFKEIVDKTEGPLTDEQFSKCLDKELGDIEIEIKHKFPNAQFADGNIFDAEIDEETMDEYRKKWEKRNGLSL